MSSRPPIRVPWSPLAASLVLVAAWSAPVMAQAPPPPPPPPPPADAPPPPPPPWSGSLGAGLAVTSGNSDTSTLNVSFDIASRPKVRHEYNYTPRFFVYGQLEYPRDPFKDIDYLIAPTAGVGYKVYDTDDLQLAFDGGVGVKWEKSTADGTRTDGAVSAGERFLRKLSTNATFTQSIAALWTMDATIEKNDVSVVTAIAYKF